LAGYEIGSSGECDICTSGKYSDEGLVCKQCEDGEWSDDTIACNSCGLNCYLCDSNSTCGTCDFGYEPTNGTCTGCDNGQ